MAAFEAIEAEKPGPLYVAAGGVRGLAADAGFLWVCTLDLRLHRASLTRWILRGVNKLINWLGSRPAA